MLLCVSPFLLAVSIYLSSTDCFMKMQSINWTKSLLGLKIQPSTVTSYLSSISVERINSRSWGFYQAGYVHNVYIAKQDDMWHLKAECYHSQRANDTPHAIKMEFDSPTHLKTSHCSCVVG